MIVGIQLNENCNVDWSTYTLITDNTMVKIPGKGIVRKKEKNADQSKSG